MILHTISSEGIVLARRNFGEADRLISIYSKNSGRVTLIAKGVRRPKSRKRGHLEVFGYLKYQSAGDRGIGILTEAEVIDDFKKIRTDLKKISLAFYIMEVVGKTTHESEPNLELFELIKSSLKELEEAKKLKSLRLRFVNELLVILGFWPRDVEMKDHDKILTDVIERQISSFRVGKRMLD